MSLLKNRGYTATVCSALVGNMVYFSMRSAVPVLYVRGLSNTNIVFYGLKLFNLYSPLIRSKLVGFRYVPKALNTLHNPHKVLNLIIHSQISTGTGVIVGEVAAGILMKPLGHSKYQLIASTVIITAFSGALAAVNQNRQSLGIAVWACKYSIVPIVLTSMLSSSRQLAVSVWATLSSLR